MRFLILQNHYGAGSPSGENLVFGNEVGFASRRRHQSGL